MNPEEQPFRKLIIAANVAGILIIFLVLIIGAATIRKITIRNKMESARVVQQQGPPPPQSQNPWERQSEADRIAGANHKEYSELLSNITDTASNRDEVTNCLKQMRKEANDMADEIKTLRSGFTDTTGNATSSNEKQLTSAYFIASGRAQQLLDELHRYRKEMVISVSIMYNNVRQNDLEESLPLDDLPVTGYAHAWDDSRFSGTCYDAQQYLDEIETDVRNFEATALTKVPITAE